jgi:hypothetical protein
MSTGVETNPKSACPATSEETMGTGEAAGSTVTLRPRLANIPFCIARKSTAFGENGTMPTVTSVCSVPSAAVPPPPQAVAASTTAASRLAVTPLRTSASRGRPR